MTRIIAGVAGGRRIAVPAKGTRPTTDRVRESLFNVLAARRDFAGLAVLDLYAGSGGLGLEALSRGARSALFVESDHRAAATVAANVRSLGLVGATVRRAPVSTVLAARAPVPVDLVFADPPYEIGNAEVETVLNLLTENGWAATGTIAVVERAAAGVELGWPRGWEPLAVRRYGDTRVEMAEYADRLSATPESG